MFYVQHRYGDDQPDNPIDVAQTVTWSFVLIVVNVLQSMMLQTPASLWAAGMRISCRYLVSDRVCILLADSTERKRYIAD